MAQARKLAVRGAVAALACVALGGCGEKSSGALAAEQRDRSGDVRDEDGRPVDAPRLDLLRVGLERDGARARVDVELREAPRRDDYLTLVFVDTSIKSVVVYEDGRLDAPGARVVRGGRRLRFELPRKLVDGARTWFVAANAPDGRILDSVPDRPSVGSSAGSDHPEITVIR